MAHAGQSAFGRDAERLESVDHRLEVTLERPGTERDDPDGQFYLATFRESGGSKPADNRFQ